VNTVRLLLGVLLAALPAPQAGQTLSFESSADTTLSENAPASKFGAATTSSADGDEPSTTGKDMVTLLKWDLSAIPPGSVVISATIQLHVTNASTEEFELYRMIRDWSEVDATWSEADLGVPWEAPGAAGPNDHGFSVRGVIQAGAAGPVKITLGPEGVTAVQAWVDGPSVNYGFILCDGGNSDGLAFASRETATPSQRPTMTVTFMASSGSAPAAANGGPGFCGATGMEAALFFALAVLIRRIFAKR
jgi:hypothetical protein